MSSSQSGGSGMKNTDLAGGSAKSPSSGGIVDVNKTPAKTGLGESVLQRKSIALMIL